MHCDLAQAREAITAHQIDRHVPDLLVVEGQLAAAGGDVDRARAPYAEAAQCFQRIGLRRELADAERRLGASRVSPPPADSPAGGPKNG